MSDLRRYQLENLQIDLSERFRFTVKRIHDENETDEDDIAFYADRAIRVNRLLTKINSRVGDLSVSIDNEEMTA